MNSLKNTHYDRVKNYVKTTLSTVAKDADQLGEFPDSLWHDLCQKYSIFNAIQQLNGTTFDTLFLEFIRLIATEYPALAAIALTQGYYGVLPIHLFGSKEQKEKYLSKMISGECVVGLGYSEFGKQGINNIETVATQTTSGFILNGCKSRISNAKEADVFLILAKVHLLNGEEDYGFFIVDSSLEGVTVGDNIIKEGLQSMSLAQVDFNNVTLPPSTLLGDILNGRIQWAFLVNHMQLGLSAISIGIAVGAFKKGLKFVKVKRGFGKRLIDADFHQCLFANLYNKVCSAETYFDAVNTTEVFGHLFISRIKLYTTEVAIEVTDEIQRLIGPIQKNELQDIQRFINDARLIEHYGESGDSIRKNIAKAWLKEE